MIFGPLGCTTEIPILSWPLVSMSCNHFFSIKKKKKKKTLNAWTTFGPDPLTKRYIGNLPWDSVHILIHYMSVHILIYIHHTFTTVKYQLQSLVSFSYIDIRFLRFVNEGHSIDTSFCNPHLILHGGLKSNFTLEMGILIVAIRSLISFHQNDLDVVMIKSI